MSRPGHKRGQDIVRVQHDELLSTKEVLVETVELVEVFKETPVMRTVSHTIDPSLPHADFIYTSDVAHIRGSTRILCRWGGQGSGLQNGGGCTGTAALRYGVPHRDQGTPYLPSLYPRVVFCWVRRIALPRNLYSDDKFALFGLRFEFRFLLRSLWVFEFVVYSKGCPGERQMRLL